MSTDVMIINWLIIRGSHVKTFAAPHVNGYDAGIYSPRSSRPDVTTGREEGREMGQPVHRAHVPVGCQDCRGTGHQGRLVLAEMLSIERNDLRRAILSRADAATLEYLAVTSGTVTRWQRACDAVCDGRTSPAKVCRVLGFGQVGDGGQ